MQKQWESQQREGDGDGDMSSTDPRKYKDSKCNRMEFDGKGDLTVDYLQSSLMLKNSALHGSMEDIHHPKNFRSRRNNTPIANKSNMSSFPTSPDFTFDDIDSIGTLVKVDFHGNGNPNIQAQSENQSLYKYIDDEKRAILLRKSAMTFMYGALRKCSLRVVELEQSNQMKSEECAARLILHNLLLNSWRNEKIKLTKAMHENAQFIISVENLTVQLRVLRHLQVSEKDRANEKVAEIRMLKNQISISQKCVKNAEAELASLLEELRFSREDNEKLFEQKVFLQKELNDLQEQKETLSTTVDLEKKRAIRAEEECQSSKMEYADLRKQMKDLSHQSFQWQERARSFEVKGTEMTGSIELRETSLRVMQSNFKLILDEVEQYKLKKDAFQEAYKTSHGKLKEELENKAFLTKNLENALSTLVSQKEKLAKMEESIVKLNCENRETQQELFGYKLKNVRTRRAWVNAIYRVNGPIKLIKYLLFGTLVLTHREET